MISDSRGSGGSLKNCDVVMKGGITSGMVYPRAILKLKDTYRFRNIGGSSAGAIAAALTAAAELNRRGGGFDRLAEATDEISTSLLDLFRPEPEFAPLFRTFLHGLGTSGGPAKAAKILATLTRGHFLSVLIGMLPGLAVAAHALGTAAGWANWVLAALLVLLGWAGGLAARLLILVFRTLPARNFGICSGKDGGDPRVLTTWLADQLDRIAGVKGRGHPLTFGDLEGAEHPINLEIMTTNLTAGQPHRIPLRKNVYMFDPDELRKLFPEDLVTYLTGCSKQFRSNSRTLFYLPEPHNLPVVMAVRMSLSFPILLQAVPLHACDYTLRDPKAHDHPLPCWFSDGGITSNFPIHFFDSVWPRWPTFGITLGDFDPARHSTPVWMPKRAGDGQLAEFRPIAGLGSFLWSIFTTAQNWQDNLQSGQSGYRERIVRIALDADEGGLNLNMDRETIQGLFDKGGRAGDLIQDFDFDSHRWKRYLVSMGQLSELFQKTRRAYEDNEDGRQPLHSFLSTFAGGEGEYKQSQEWWSLSLDHTEQLMADVANWNMIAEKGTFPKPPSKLRGKPEV